MPNPTRQEIIDAYSALDDLRDNALEWEGVKAQKQYHAVLKILPPKPRPTMAEVEWDDDKHYLAEAEQEFYGNVIMLGLANDGFIRFFIPNSSEQHFTMANPKTLTPTGKRYTLTEVQE